MGKKSRKSKKPVTLAEPSGYGDATRSRFLEEVGEQVQELRHTLGWRIDRTIFPYSVRVSWPERHMQEHLVVLKVLEDGKPKIAFHTAAGALAGMFSMSDRYRAGKLKFVDDQYPPENLDALWAHVRERTKFLKGLRKASPQSSKT